MNQSISEEWEKDNSPYRNALAEAMVFGINALKDRVVSEKFADGLVDARNKVDQEVEKIIQSKISQALTAERKELREKVNKLEYEWAGTNEEKEKDKFVYLYEVLSLLEENNFM